MKLSKEERYLAKLEKDTLKAERKAQREQKRLEREALKLVPKAPKQEPTEAELVRRYANRVIKNQIYHGRIDDKKFKGLKDEQKHSVSKNLWMDADFFFSVVFQSSEQKMEFLKQLNCGNDPKEQAQIINGLELAKHLGITLKLETSKDYPIGDPTLMPLVLDNEKLGE